MLDRCRVQKGEFSHFRGYSERFVTSLCVNPGMGFLGTCAVVVNLKSPQSLVSWGGRGFEMQTDISL